jgi:hypothetical protein
MDKKTSNTITFGAWTFVDRLLTNGMVRKISMKEEASIEDGKTVSKLEIEIETTS